VVYLPLWKNMKVQLGLWHSNIWTNKTCSKPPTSSLYLPFLLPSKHGAWDINHPRSISSHLDIIPTTWTWKHLQKHSPQYFGTSKPSHGEELFTPTKNGHWPDGMGVPITSSPSYNFIPRNHGEAIFLGHKEHICETLWDPQNGAVSYMNGGYIMVDPL
jgi:hypothetical protein